MSLPKPRAILFDWDNTLVDTWPVIHRALNETLTFMGHEPWTMERVQRDVKRSMRDAFPELFGERWKLAAQHYQDSYKAIHLDDILPLPGAEALLALLKMRGIHAGVVSNKRGPTLRLEAKKLGWEKHFLALAGSGDAVHDKPDAAHALLALEQGNHKTGADIWFIGDTAVDLECAHAIGATPILYGPHALVGLVYEGIDIAAHVRDHAELQKLIMRD
jgi:phosphoglycolate phosphatase